MLRAIVDWFVTFVWIALALFGGVPAAVFFLIWFLGLERQTMRRLLVGVLVAAVAAATILVLSQSHAQASAVIRVRPNVEPPRTEVDKRDDVIISCEYCWWCIECIFMNAGLGDPASVDFEIQQTFNPF